MFQQSRRDGVDQFAHGAPVDVDGQSGDFGIVRGALHTKLLEFLVDIRALEERPSFRSLQSREKSIGRTIQLNGEGLVAQQAAVSRIQNNATAGRQDDAR